MVEFQEVINDTNYINIANKAISKYRKCLDDEELNQCKYIGIWKACKKYKGDFNLSTFIFKNISWECIRQININNKFTYENISDIGYSDNSLFTKLIDCLNDEELDLIKDRFISNKTIKEIAEERNLSLRQVSCKINKILKLAKKVLS